MLPLIVLPLKTPTMILRKVAHASLSAICAGVVLARKFRCKIMEPFCSGVDKRVVSKRVGFADVPLERKPERGHVRQNHPFTKPPFYLPMTLFGVDKSVVSKRVVSADVPPERKPERGYVRQNHPFTKPPFYLPVICETG